MLLEDLPTKVTYSIKGDCNWHTKQAAILQEQPRKTSQLTLTVDVTGDGTQAVRRCR
jgi:hypothetical protein